MKNFYENTTCTTMFSLLSLLSSHNNVFSSPSLSLSFPFFTLCGPASPQKQKLIAQTKIKQIEPKWPNKEAKVVS